MNRRRRLIASSVTFCVRSLEPKRIAHHPGVSLKVVTAESEKRSAANPRAATCEATPPNSPLPDSVSALRDPNTMSRNAVYLATSNTVSEFVVFEETAGNDTLDDSDSEDENEDEDEIPDLEGVPLEGNSKDNEDVQQETVQAEAGDTWSEDDELEAEFALQYYFHRKILLTPGIVPA